MENTKMIAVAFPEAMQADKLRLEILNLQKEYLIELEDVVVANRDAESGKVKLHQATNLTAAGAVSGGFWGMLVGTIFLSPLVGMAVGAASGAISGSLADYGINDDFMKDLAKELPAGGSALFLLVRSATGDKVLDKIKGFGGTVIHSSLTKEQEARLQQALSDTKAKNEEATTSPA